MSKTKYLVVAATGYAGAREGDTVELELTAEQEKRAVERGSIKKATKAQKQEEETTDA